MIREQLTFPNRLALAQGLASRVARVLSAAVSKKGHAVLAVSGGTTPRLFFEELSMAEITWEKITVTLVDERQVPEDSPRSNAKLVRETLIQAKATAAIFVPLFRNATAEKLPDFDATVLGMGEDGHTASFFPGGDTLAKAIDPTTSDSLIDISSPGSGEPRITFTLPRLVASGYLALHIESEAKQRVLDQALAGTDVHKMPVRAVLQTARPIDVYWCP